MQHDYNIANSDGATVRADINSALQSLAECSSGATAPSTTFAYQWWADTGNDLLKQRNAANSAWISILTLSTGVPFSGAGGSSLGTDSIIRTNLKTIDENITFAGTENGSTVGPITISSGYTVTVTSGSTWTIL
jgi:hypothetical protein